MTDEVVSIDLMESRSLQLAWTDVVVHVRIGSRGDDDYSIPPSMATLPASIVFGSAAGRIAVDHLEIHYRVYPPDLNYCGNTKIIALGEIQGGFMKALRPGRARWEYRFDADHWPYAQHIPWWLEQMVDDYRPAGDLGASG